MALPLSKKIVFSAIVVLAALALLEGAARVLLPSRPTNVYTEHRRLITFLGLPEANATMTFDPVLFWKLKPELEGLRVRGRIVDVELDFSVSTNRLGLRSAEVGEKAGGLRVLALGDSCTFGLGVEDEEAWPARLEVLLSERLDAPVEVINGGVPGYTSYQGLTFFENAGLALEPDLVLVSFGFNDIDSWSSRTDNETARWMRLQRRVRDIAPFLRKSRVYQGLAQLREVTWERQPKPEVVGSATPRVSEEEFYENLVAIQRLAAERDIPVSFVIWPYRDQVRKQHPGLIHYQPLTARAGRDTSAQIIKLYDAFESLEREGVEPFLDHIHASAPGSAAAAQGIAAAVEDLGRRALGLD